jgi:hypothetical protein
MSIYLIVEASERAPALQSRLQLQTGYVVADAVSEVDPVLVPDVGRERVDRNQIQLVDLDRV